MKKSFFIVLLATQLSNAQNAKVDSLKSLALQKSGVEKIDLLYELAYELVDMDNKASLSFGQKSLAQAKKTGDSLRMVKAGKIIATALRRMERYDSAILMGSYCEKIADRNGFTEEHGNILNGLGVACLFISKYDEALSYFTQYTNLYGNDKNKEMASSVQNNIGLVYYKLKDYNNALEFFRKSIRTRSPTNNADIRLINISLCYSFLGNLTEARQQLQPVLKRCLSGCDGTMHSIALFASGIMWFKSDSINMATENFLQSYLIAKRSNIDRLTFDNVIYLSKIHLQKGALKEVEKFLLEGETMLRTSHFDLEEIKLYEELCALYTAKKDYKKLARYQEKYIQLKDSVFNEKHTNNLMTLHAEATENENKVRLASQEQTMALKNQIIERQKYINVLVGLVVLLMIVLIYFLFRILQDRKLINLRLNQKVKDRTEDLKRNHNELISAIRQRDALVAQLSHDLNASLESMQMLCRAGSKAETHSSALRYFEEINSTTLSLSNSLSSILTESRIAS